MGMKLRIAFFFVIGLLTITIPDAYGVTFNAGRLKLNKKVKTMRQLKRENVVTQSLDYSCGAAGLSTLLNYYLDDPVTEQEIIKTLLQITPLEKVKERRGFSLFDLKRFAQMKGYQVTGYKMDMDFLKELDQPVLVPIRFKSYRHFVIVKGIVADRVFIADPAVGNMSMRIEKFKSMWPSGIGLVVEHKEGKEPLSYALKVKEKDIRIGDYANMRKLINRTPIRTSIFPAEY